MEIRKPYGFSDLRDINPLKFDFAIFQDTNLKKRAKNSPNL